MMNNKLLANLRRELPSTDPLIRIYIKQAKTNQKLVKKILEDNDKLIIVDAQLTESKAEQTSQLEAIEQLKKKIMQQKTNMRELDLEVKDLKEQIKRMKQIDLNKDKVTTH